ncbi:carboxypeptidase regulatory-like domain-containing protein [Patescibacteria group bacterium]|nr:carboxypeptidase regulatory-like domain-containing protein [Patescibacteria group bacterium]
MIKRLKEILRHFCVFLVFASIFSGLIYGGIFIYKKVVYAFTWQVTLMEDADLTDWPVGRSMSVKMESATKTHMAYCNDNTFRVHYSTVTSAVSSTPEYVEDQNTACAGRNIDITFASAIPIIAFEGNLGDLFYAIRNGAGAGNADDVNWNFYTVTITNYNVSGLSFAVTGNTYGIAFYDDTDDQLVYAQCTADCSTQTNWTYEAVDTGGVGDIVGKYPDMVFNGAGQPVISYVNTTSNTIKYAIRDGGGSCADYGGDADWSCYTIDSVDTAAFSSGIDLDSGGNIGITYAGTGVTDKQVRYAYQDAGAVGCVASGNSTFTCETATTTSQGSMWTDIEFNGTVPMIAWYHAGTDDDLYFTYDDGGWVTEAVYTSGDSGSYTAIDNFGTAVAIGFYGTGEEAYLAVSTISFNSAPTLTAITPSQTGANIVTITTTIADVDLDVTSLIVDYSTDNITWASSTLANVIQNGEVGTGVDGVVTSTGSITDIDTDNDGSVDLTIEWNANADIPGVDDSSVYFRLTPNDGTINGTTVSSTAFAVDTKAPTAPGNLSISVTSTSGFDLAFGAQTVDTNFSEYRIYYGLGGGIGPELSPDNGTEHDDADLDFLNYNGTATTSIAILSSNTFYRFNIWAYDSYARYTGGATNATGYTLAPTPTNVAVSSITTSSAQVDVDSFNNDSADSSAYYFGIIKTSDSSAIGNSGWLPGDNSWITTDDALTMVENTQYTAQVKYRNGNGIETTTSTANFYTLAIAPTNLATTTIGANGASFSVDTFPNDDGGSAGYYFDVINTATLVELDNSGWQSGVETWTVTGATPNTQYTVRVKYRNGDGTETAVTILDFYTWASTPSLVTASANNTTQITVSWSGNATQYYVERVTVAAGVTVDAASGWTVNTSHVFSGLTPNTTYSFRVKGKNTAGTDTGWSGIVSATTQNSGTPIPNDIPILPDPKPECDPNVDPECAPCNPAVDPECAPSGVFNINNNAKYTNKRDVILYFNSQVLNDYSIISYAISEEANNFEGSFIDFNNVFQIPYSIKSGEDGEKIVYVKFFSTKYGSFPPHKDFIILDTTPPRPPSITKLYIGFNGGIQYGYSFFAYGKSEPGATILITRKNNLKHPNFPSNLKNLGDNLDQLKFFANQGGGWFSNSVLSPSGLWLDPVPVIIIFQAQDLAGNISKPYQLEYDLSFDDIDIHENPKEDEEGCIGDECEEDLLPDTDKDGRPDEIDNCPFTPNPNQNDQDGDGIGDACDDTNDQDDIDDECEGAGCDEPEPKPKDDQDGDKPADDSDIPVDSGGDTPLGSGSSGNDGSSFPVSSDPLIAYPLDSDTLKKLQEDVSTDNLFDNIVNITEPVISAIKKIIDNPKVEAVNEKVVAPAIAGVGIANMVASVAVGGFQLPQLIALLRYLFTQPFLLLRLRKRKNWGVVYDAFTKQPVDLATVRIIDVASNKVVRSQVTDVSGRYLLIANPGTYKLEISKPGYSGFSEYMHEVKEDSKYINIYHGEEVTVDEPTVFNFNIPLDPSDRELTTIKILKDHSIKVAQNTIALSGLLITLISFTISPTAIIALFFFLHLLFYSIFYRFSHINLPTVWGKVVELVSNQPLGKVVIRIFDSAYNKLVETGVTDRKGRYAILVGPSKYYVTYDKLGYVERESPELDYSSEKTQGMGGIVNRSEVMMRDRGMEDNKEDEDKI